MTKCAVASSDSFQDMEKQLLFHISYLFSLYISKLH